MFNNVIVIVLVIDLAPGSRRFFNEHSLPVFTGGKPVGDHVASISNSYWLVRTKTHRRSLYRVYRLLTKKTPSRKSIT